MYDREEITWHPPSTAGETGESCAEYFRDVAVEYPQAVSHWNVSARVEFNVGELVTAFSCVYL